MLVAPYSTWNRFKAAAGLFLNTELDTGLMFAKLRLDTRDRARAARHQRSARVAYDSAIRHMDHVVLSLDETQKITTKLTLLRTKLEELGESL